MRNRKKRRLIVYGCMFLGLIILAIALRTLLFKSIVIGLLIIIASVSKLYKRITSISLGLEFVTPFTIIFAYSYGALFGIATSIVMLVISTFLSGKMDFAATFGEIVVYTIISILTVMLSTLPFIGLASAMVVLRNILLYFIGTMMLGKNFVQLFITVSTDIFINIIVISTFGPGIINLI